MRNDFEFNVQRNGVEGPTSNLESIARVLNFGPQKGQLRAKMWASIKLTFNMDCFRGDVTSVMTLDRCAETTLPDDTGRLDVKGSDKWT